MAEEVEPVVRSGKELVRKLKELGTGNAKLDVAREVIRKDAKASSATVLAALEAAGVGEGALEKAKSIVKTGTYTVPVYSALNIEDEPDADEEPKAEPAPKSVEVPKAAEVKPAPVKAPQKPIPAPAG